MAFSCCCSHSGDGPFFTPLITRPKKCGQPSVSSMRTPMEDAPWHSTGAAFGATKLPSPAAARSRAIPTIPAQSARFGVRPISITGSFRPKISAIGVPTARLSSTSIMPSCSSESIISFSDTSIPQLSTPRILAFLRVTSRPGI